MADKPWAERKDHYIENYRRRRAELIERLGGECLDCGANESLEFDHLETRTWIAAQKSRWSRIAHYEREAAEGLIELRCKSCNKKKGEPRKLALTDDERF